MSAIGINGDEVAALRTEIEDELEPFHKSFHNIESCDGGIASNMIGLIASATFEAARASGDSFHALMTVTTEVAKDFQRNEDAAIESLHEFVSQLDPFS